MRPPDAPQPFDRIPQPEAFEVGIHIVPLMKAAHVVELCVEADRLGYDYALVADEGFHPDVYACLGAAALATSRIKLGPVTNGYTRHPAVTAAAVATLNELSSGRAVATLLAGGSMVLGPMAIERTKPYRAVKDTADVALRLWTGDEISWSGHNSELANAQLASGRHDIELWMTSRSPLLLGLAGRSADVALITVKPDLEAAFDLVDSAASAADRDPPRHAYLGRLCYRPDMIAEQRSTIGYVLMDSPPRVLTSLGFDESAIALVSQARAENAAHLLDELITEELLLSYQINGTPDQCATALRSLVAEHDLSIFLADVLSPDLDENMRLLRETYGIVEAARN